VQAPPPNKPVVSTLFALVAPPLLIQNLQVLGQIYLHHMQKWKGGRDASCEFI